MQPQEAYWQEAVSAAARSPQLHTQPPQPPPPPPPPPPQQLNEPLLTQRKVFGSKALPLEFATKATDRHFYPMQQQHQQQQHQQTTCYMSSSSTTSSTTATSSYNYVNDCVLPSPDFEIVRRFPSYHSDVHGGALHEHSAPTASAASAAVFRPFAANYQLADDGHYATTTPRPESHSANEDTRSKIVDHKQQQTTGSSSTSNAPLSVENICWFVASVLCVYISDIGNVLLFDQRIYRSLMLLAFALIALNIAIAFYMVVWMTHVKKISSSRWNEIHPQLIPIATASFVIGSILLAIAIWPVYSWITGPLLFTIFMGFVVILINLPVWI